MSATVAKQSRQVLAKERNRQKLLQAGLAIEEKNAKLAKSLGFFPSRHIFVPFPIREHKKTTYKKTNGNWTLKLENTEYGVPYGVYARIELARLVSIAVKTKSPELALKPISQHLKEFNILPTGGQNGTIERYRNQMLRLFTMSVNRSMHSDELDKGLNFHLVHDYELWKASTAPPYIILTDYFFNEIVGCESNKGSAVPFDMRAIKALKHSPLQMDIYLFLSYRFNAIRQNKFIPWLSLQKQFSGSDTNDEDSIVTPEQLRNFKKRFIAALKSVLVVYPDANIAMSDGGIWLKRSRSHA